MYEKKQVNFQSGGRIVKSFLNLSFFNCISKKRRKMKNKKKRHRLNFIILTEDMLKIINSDENQN